MDHPEKRPAGAFGTAGNAPTVGAELRDKNDTRAVAEAWRCGERSVAVLETLGELSNRLEAINRNITGSSNPETEPRPRPDSLGAVISQIEDLVYRCNRMAHVIEANLS